MHLTTIALVISILGLASSFVLVGIIPSLISLTLGIRLLIEERTIEVVRIVAISFVGVILPIIMYLNTYGISFPRKNEKSQSVFTYIISENYERLGLYKRQAKEDPAAQDEMLLIEAQTPEPELIEAETAEPELSESESLAETEPDTYMIDNGIKVQDTSGSGTATGSKAGMPEIFESLDSIKSEEKNQDGVLNVAASDDDMPSYGGLPVGTMLVAQYFREDDHNCNPVLVLRNETGNVCRYECIFTARDSEGNALATSEKTVEVVRDKGVFVFEGRFDKRQLGGTVPDSYEFLVSKRKPYEKDMSSEVAVYTETKKASSVLTAQNKSNVTVKVDAYVLYFDGNELVDCMWMIPQNTGEVLIGPGSTATVQGNAYYRFDRVETYYTAYETSG
jgi:hypothetical protein